MACPKCVLNRLEGTGMNVQVEDGELRILGCQKHIKILLDRYKMGVKQEETHQIAIKELERLEREEAKKNEEDNRGVNSPENIDTADSPEDYSGEDTKDIREEGI